MKIALISSCENFDYKKIISPNCTKIITNITNLENVIQDVPIEYETDIDILIKNADWVMVIYDKKHKKLPAVISKCKNYHISVEFINADVF